MATKYRQFAEWLSEELKERDWRPADLVRVAKIDSGLVSRVLSGMRGVGPETCRVIAHALDVDEVIVFRKAGLLSPLPPADAEEDELLHEERKLLQMYRNLSPSARAAALAMLRGLSNSSSAQ